MPKKKVRKKQNQLAKQVTPEQNELSIPEGWSAVRATVAAYEKATMAEHFVSHDLFVEEGQTPKDDRKITSAKIIVNPGTAPNAVVNRVLEWVKSNIESYPGQAAPPHITWYTPGALVPATLLDFRVKHRHLRNSCGLHMFPGMVDPDLEMVRGAEAVRYALQLEKWFTYALLSAYAFDMNTGTAFFYFDDEVELQKAIALREAEQKFLFIDPKKFRREGSKGYSIRELLQTSRTVTIYTVSSDKDTIIEEQFSNLADRLLDSKKTSPTDCKMLRLVIADKKINKPFLGELKSESAK